MTEDLRQRVKLFGQLAIAYSILNEEDGEKSKNLREELQLEVFMPNTSLDKEGKTILVAIEDSVISIGISLIAAQKMGLCQSKRILNGLSNQDSSP